MRVVIAGGGSVGKFIEQLHKGGHEVLIIDNDPAVVKRALAAREPKVPWIPGRPARCRRAEANVDKADVVAAVTGDDEDNPSPRLLASRSSAFPCRGPGTTPRTVMFNQMWAWTWWCRRRTITALVEEAVSVGSFVRLLSSGGRQGQAGRGTLAPARRPPTRRSPSSASRD